MTLTLLPAPGVERLAHLVLKLSAGEPGSRRLLLIEDDISIATMYRLQLEADGYSVEHAADGASGLHLAQQSPPGLVLLDVRLPRLGGLDVLRAMAADPRLAMLPVIVLSNYSDQEMVKEGIRLGARAYLVKSQTTPDQLSRKVSEYLPD